MSDIKEGRKYKVAFEYHFSDFDEVIWNGNEWYFNTIPEIKRFLAKYDKHCKIKMAEIKLIETKKTDNLKDIVDVTVLSAIGEVPGNVTVGVIDLKGKDIG